MRRPVLLLAGALIAVLPAGSAAAVGPGAAVPAAVAAAPAPSGTAQVSPVAAQTIENIGVSGAWWVNDLANFAPSVQRRVAQLLFSDDGLALSSYRYNIGGGGAGVTDPVRAPQTFRTAGGYDWSADPGGQTFLRYAARYGVKDLIGFVNSAPGALTTNGQACGGSLVAGDEAAYATYLTDIVNHFAKSGIKLDYLSPFNEPDSSFSGCGQEGMSVPVSQRAAIVQALGASLAAHAPGTGIIADESSQLAQFNNEAPQWLSLGTASQYANRLAHHTYDNPGNAAMTATMNVGRRFHKPTWASEICCFAGIGTGWGQQYDPTITSGLAMADIMYKDFAITGDTAFQWWVALAAGIGCDPVANPGCETQINSTGWNDGLIYYDPRYATDHNQSLYLTKRYYAMAQYSRFVRPGAVRYPVTGAPPGVQALAFQQDGAWTLVVNNLNTVDTPLSVHLNSGAAVRTATAYRTSATQDVARVGAPSVAGGTVGDTLPARSITTYVLRQGRAGAASAITGPLVNQNAGKCLTLPDGAAAEGGALTISACAGTAGQAWTYTPAGELRVNGDRCLDTTAQSSADGTRAAVYPCTGDTSQQWLTRSDGTVIDLQSGKCLDDSGWGTGDGNPVIVWTCGGGANQSWYRS
ncbi:MAG TPA: glycoside hydrolase [Rugosimonospora sp.]|nr:glycoside hydrolase [Rugosimonospora sp.]